MTRRHFDFLPAPAFRTRKARKKSKKSNLARGQRNGEAAGLTLVEVVVTAAIAVLVGAVALGGLFAARERMLVQAAAEQVASFLRETADLTLNRRAAAGCEAAASAECRTYQVRVTAGGREYQRQAVGTTNPGPVARRELPRSAQFGSDNLITFEYAAPLLRVTSAAGGRGAIVIRHARRPGLQRCVRIYTQGAVEVTGPAAGGGC